MKVSEWMCLGENISYLIRRDDRMKINSITSKMLTNKMTIYLNMFGAIKKNIIMSNQNDAAIVTIKDNGPISTSNR